MSKDFGSNGDTLSVFGFLTHVNSSLAAHRGRVVGEVTSVKDSYQTAVYFSIKDLEQDALLNCVIWRTTYRQNGVAIKEGDTVIVTGVPEIYPARGSFSMKVQTIEYAGEGALKKSYDALRRSLELEGLLATERKRLLPQYPKKIGVITSRSGVVMQDFSANLGRYGFEVTMVDSRVEGKDAIHELLIALRTMCKQNIEVLVIMRGGGSWESLQAFNTESVVRAIANFSVPVVTGIGHDVDVTLAELVADVGTSTPTAVAEALNETWDTLSNYLESTSVRMSHVYRRQLVDVGRSLEQRESIVLRRYDQVLMNTRGRLEQIRMKIRLVYRMMEQQVTEVHTKFGRIAMAMRSELKTCQLLMHQTTNLLQKQFRTALRLSRDDTAKMSVLLLGKQAKVIRQTLEQVAGIEQTIKRADPASQLKLGYSLVYHNGKLTRSVKELALGESVEVKITDGSFISTIKKVE